MLKYLAVVFPVTENVSVQFDVSLSSVEWHPILYRNSFPIKSLTRSTSMAPQPCCLGRRQVERQIQAELEPGQGGGVNPDQKYQTDMDGILTIGATWLEHWSSARLSVSGLFDN